ncbi:MAG: ABC-2 transporter permease [Solibacillus sp.]
MNALLHLQWSMHKSKLLFFLIGISLITYFFHNAGTEMSLVTFALVFSANSIDITKRMLTDNNGQLSIYSMPIARQTIIKNLYIVNFIFCTIIFALILPAQIYSGVKSEELNMYLITFAGFYGGCIIGTAFHLAFQLKNIKNTSTSELFLSSIGGIMLILIPHMGISFIPHEPSFWLRLLIMPTISVGLYMYLAKRGIKKFADRELI